MAKIRRSSLILSASVVLAVLTVLVLGASAGTTTDDWLAGRFDGSRQEVETFVGFYRSIELTPEQEQVRVAALQEMPAPCCDSFSAATCCCECNLSRSLWGLSKLLIVEKGASAEQVRTAATAWIDAINPSGYAGDTCQSGHCGLPFSKSGCGGMHPDHLSF